MAVLGATLPTHSCPEFREFNVAKPHLEYGIFKVVVKLLSSIALCDPIYCSPPGSVHGISQTRILEWVAISSSRGSSQPRDQTQVACNWQVDSLPLCHLRSQHWQIIHLSKNSSNLKWVHFITCELYFSGIGLYRKTIRMKGLPSWTNICQ